MPRRRHPIKELEAVLREYEERGWRVDIDRGYFRLRCPCEERAQRLVHLTPSGANYERNLRGWLRRRRCWS